MSKGLYLGKFMPIHHGHIFVIDAASRLVDELTVLVCSIESEPIDGRLRAKWVRKTVNENVVVQELHEDIPQSPEDHEEFWNIWREAISRFGNFDKVFGGEDYVVRLAQEIGAIPVPLGRETVCVSATDIRKDPFKNWSHIPESVKSYFQRRVTLIGPESTGKSTLSVMLSKQFNSRGIYSNLMTEYGRIYDTTLKKGQNWTSEDFKVIASTHKAMREALSTYAGPILIEDTDAIQTMAWEKLLTGNVHYENYDLGDKPNLYLLLSPDVPWVDDGTRYGEKYRESMYTFLIEQLQGRGYPFRVIQGNNWIEREQQALVEVNRVLSGT